jgi:hypothetical protein
LVDEVEMTRKSASAMRASASCRLDEAPASMTADKYGRTHDKGIADALRRAFGVLVPLAAIALRRLM